ncbi:MAG: hypothetical protein WBW75_22030 [Mycobacterium sp.]
MTSPSRSWMPSTTFSATHPEGSAVPGGVPVPRWSWDGLVSR